MKDYKKECYKARANLTYYRNLNKQYKKEITFARYDNRLLESKITRLKRQIKEKDYLIIELMKKMEERNEGYRINNQI